MNNSSLKVVQNKLFFLYNLKFWTNVREFVFRALGLKELNNIKKNVSNRMTIEIRCSSDSMNCVKLRKNYLL